MCRPKNILETGPGRKGSRLSDGEDHAHDHCAWSRRSFLSTLGIAGVGTAMVQGGIPVRAIAESLVSRSLAGQPSERTLVLIQLDGGNDGLNTVIPFNNDLYYNARPTLAIPRSNTLEITSEHGLHSSLSEFRSLFDQGKLGIVQNVGYPAPDLSHFRSTDIWATASNSNEYISTGWMGRMLNNENPNFLTEPPEHPLAVQIGGPGLMFRGPATAMGMSVRDLDRFIQFMQDGRFYTLEGLPETPVGDEMWYLRNTVNSAFRYGSVIQEASENGSNSVPYPENYLAESLSVVAQLIKGGLQTNIYMVTLGGFDTHASQGDEHSSLLSQLSSAVAAFLDDIPDGPVKDNLLLMTFSEFGRRIYENGSEGTDHGTAAPMFLIGNALNGGFYGSEPDLSNQDEGGNLIHTTSFQSVYASVLSGWFGLNAAGVSSVLGSEYESLPLFASGTSVEDLPTLANVKLLGNYPNPFSDRTAIRIQLARPENITINVYDIGGRHVAQLVNGQVAAGVSEFEFGGAGLASGIYLYKVTGPSISESGKMLLNR
ncbi:MAG: DUF1501 domain-containing protein [Rhodothermales bacterium]|nr:DUF1501 domain-containing protein [Rhodothermales bacterium]